MIDRCWKFSVLSLCAVAAALLPAFGPTLSAQTGDVVISTNTTYATGTYNLTSLTVRNGATLAIGGGSTLSVSGAVLVTANSNIVLQGANTSAQVNGMWAGVGSTINAASVEVDAGSSINADTQGYTANAGPGAGASGSSNGGSYGGAGGGQTATTAYGSDTAPIDLGSGGGSYESTGGTGGGSLRLIVSGTLTDNGIISADGGTYIVCTGSGACGGGFAGGGAGGSVYVTAGTLTGSGTFNADGGPNATGYGGGGGGGRVAVYYNSATNFSGTAASTAAGGTVGAGGSPAGSVGTVGFFSETGSGNNDGLVVEQPFTIPAGTTATYASITVRNGAMLTVGGGSTLTVSGAVLVTGNSTIVLQGANTSAQVNGAWAGVGSTISAASVEVDAGSSINADAQGYTANAGPGTATGGTNGGSYGGAGGGQASTTTYGSDTAPVDLGSGGGSYESTGGTGGGAVHLLVSGALTNNGIISANGGTYIVCTGSGACGGGFAGGGAGGSINVSAGSLAGSGTFNANGGANSSSYGSGGGGGRVAVYYNGTNSSFTGFTGSTASGGVVPTNNGSVIGAVGTIAFFDTSATNNKVAVYQNFVVPAASNVQYDSLTVANGATLAVGGGSTVTVAGAVLVTAASEIILQSANTTAQVNGAWAGIGGTIRAGSLEVDAGSTINADGQGYLPFDGPGSSTCCTTNGGSYGGVGGGQPSSTIYGSATAPTDLGSGGGQYQGTSLPGGGAVRLIVSGALTNNGIISASAPAVSGFVGGSAGGSVYVTTGTLTGSGTFNADGGSNASTYGSGGGGGRVAVYSNNAAAFTGFTASTATGAMVVAGNGGVSGSNGTVGFFDTSVANDNLAVYQNFTIPAGTSPTYNSVSVNTGGLLTIGGGTALKLNGTLTVSGTVVAQSANNTAQVNGVWSGTGVAINAASITVNANGSLNADTQGYVANAGLGGAPANTSAGGSYGGLGGVGNGAVPAPTYGSEMLPVDLGSGGGSGSGGGELLLTVSGTLTDNGTISANGATGSGGGAGGSVQIHTATLAGVGSIAANGGSGGNAGGGGGRVALYFSNNSFNVALATAMGGTSDGGNAGAVGTVYIPGKVASTTVLTFSPPQLTLGQTATLQATVTAASPGPTPTGMVSFLDGTTVIGTQALVASQASGTASAQLQTTALAVGPHSITASYVGDGNTFASASTAQTVTVGQATSTTALTVSASTITAAQSETLTAKVIGLTSPAITGNVTFFDGATSLGNGALTAAAGTGTATLTVPTLGVGSHSLSAHYNGDTNYTASGSAPQTVTVTGTAQTITFPAIPNHVYGDAPFALTATASSGLAVSYNVVSGSATVTGSTITLTGVGMVTIQATQAGNTTYSAATPVARSFVVTAPVPTLASITPTLGVVGSGATTLTLTGTNFATTDTVLLNGAAIPSTQVSGTSLTATLPASFFATAGTGLITVTDSASGLTSTSATFTVVAAPQFVLSGPSTATSGAQPALTFTLTNPYPFPLAGALTLTFAPISTTGVTDDPAVQFATGGRTITFTIPANSTATPAVQLQTGTIAGAATVALAVTSNGVNITPSNIVPVVITIPASVPALTSAKLTSSGQTLTVAVVGFSNTREVTKAVFHFTPAAGSSIKDPDVTIDVGAVFSGWYGSTASDAYGSTFTYTQPFTLDSDASTIAGITVTLTNSVGVSVVVPAQ